MTTITSTGLTRLRSAFALGAAATTLGIAVSACSSSATTAAAPAGASHSTATAAAKPAGRPGAGGGSPCGLLTQAEVDTAGGQPLRPGTLVGPADCAWNTSDVSAGVELQTTDWQTIKRVAAAPGQTATPVGGVGDEAFVNGNAELEVRKGSAGFQLGVFGPNTGTTEQRLAREKVLATAVLGRL